MYGTVGPLAEEHARTICAWQYEEPYQIYCYGSYEQARDQGEAIADAELRAQRFVGVFTETGAVTGFVELTETEASVVIGLGLAPDCCGQGWGRDLVAVAVQTAQERYPGRRITLEVRCFNERAIKCYQRSGFVIADHYVRQTPSGSGDFYRMEYRGSSV